MKCSLCGKEVLESNLVIDEDTEDYCCDNCYLEEMAKDI